MTTYQEERIPLPTPWRLVRELRLRRPPWWMVMGLVVLVVATWIPLSMIYTARTTKSRIPRVHFFLDMDKQAKFGPQSSHPWFVDGRAMRQPVAGTIARGELSHDQPFALGFLTSDGTRSGKVIEFTKSLPAQLVVDLPAQTLRGRGRYQIFCMPCHGDLGVGDGPINQRALELKESKWVPATNLLTQTIRDRPDGQVFQAISDGVRNMPGYRWQISIEDRWAIVAYVRQLQATQPVAPEPKPTVVPPPAGADASPNQLPK